MKLDPRRVAYPATLLVVTACMFGAPAFAAVQASHAATVPAHHTVAAAAGGSLRSWGLNTDGQLGNGAMLNSDLPVKVDLPRGTRIVQARAGAFFSVALTSTGEVLAWGDNFNNQLGNNSMLNTDKPVRVHIPAHTKITEVRAGCAFGLALTSRGQVLAWGLNTDGQLGDGKLEDGAVPQRVRLPKGVTVTGISAGCAHSLAVTSTGRVLAWGDNLLGELGTGNIASSDVPVRVKLAAKIRVTAVAAGSDHSLALTSKGRVLAWGDNGDGELGNGKNGDFFDLPVAVKLPGKTTVTRLAGGDQHSLALTSKGQVLAWGFNSFGELGDGSTTDSDLPVKVKLPAGTKVIGIAAGSDHSLALTSKGHVLAWGENGFGELGDGNTTNSDLPVKVKLPASADVIAVASGPGADHSLAIEAVGKR
jgi:alpha-tubulin suppressor-like RCC1 family protein